MTTEWKPSVTAVTLFVRDLEASRAFYENIFGLPVHFSDDESVVFRFGNTLINLLAEHAAPELISPATLAPATAGVRFQLTVGVEDVDELCTLLTQRGAELLNGPIDRPWGVRTASLRDPDGNIWELAA
jgi:lactoylglutathione lyase